MLKSLGTFAAAFFLLSGTFMLQCDILDDDSDDNSSGTTGPSTATHIKMESMSYSEINDSTLKIINRSDSCDDSTLVTTYDTSNATYKLSGDTLIIIESSDDSEELDTMKLVRVGTGSGIQGQWAMPMEDNEMFEDVTIAAYVSETTIDLWIPKTVGQQLAAFFQAMIATGYGTIPTITVDTTGEDITLTNTTSNEVVTISVNNELEIVWTSTNSEHETHTVSIMDEFTGPTSCPETEADLVPEWMSEFAAGSMTMYTFPPLPRFFN